LTWERERKRGGEELTWEREIKSEEFT